MWYNVSVDQLGYLFNYYHTNGALIMTEKVSISDSAALKKLFQSDKNSCSPYIYLPLDSKNDMNTPEKLARLISGYKRSGFGGIIPFCNKKTHVTALSDEYYNIYSIIKEETASNALSLAYLDDSYIMREYLKKLDDSSDVVCKVLCRYEFVCTEGELMKRKLHTDGVRMSLVAVNDDDLTILDIREFVKDNVLEWTPPAGNWNVEEYVCECDYNSNYIDLMDYDVSSEYLKRTFGVLMQQLDAGATSVNSDSDASPFDLFIYRNIVFAGQNRRMWHPDFNRVFEEMYGFDPAPYYTLMFRDYFANSKRYKCMLMSCRSKMFGDGYLKAAADYCKVRSIFCTGFPAESKATACSWMFGDGQMFHRYSSAPGVSMPFAYLYGLNGIRVASSAADMMGADTVSADMFNYFKVLTRDIIYREAMNAFSRGVNMVFAHLGEDRAREDSDIIENENSIWGSIFSKGDDLADFAGFVTRVQTMLRGGEHISEAAVIYPIRTLHSLSYLYQSNNTEFEYPFTPETADYMEVMNNFLNYVGIDTLFLHPDVVTERAFSEDGVMYLPGEKNTMKFKLLILPSMSIISLKTLRVIKKFFDEGGKIIATNNLPVAASECSAIFEDINTALRTESSEDREVRETIEYIFSSDVNNNRLYKRYYKNESEKGGVAYFFPSNKTSIDRTESVSANLLYQATSKFEFSPDVYIDKMPRREFLGIVNYHLTDFLKIGVDKRLAKGCSMNYIHKKYAGCDIYYFTNTSSDKYSGSILLKGRHNPEEWNPYTGKTHRLIGSLVRFRNEIYTKVELSLEASSCTFIVSPVPHSNKEVLRDLTAEEIIPEFYARENF